MKTYRLNNPETGESFTTTDGEMASSYTQLGWIASEIADVKDLKDLREALAFLDACRADPKNASETGSFKDAWEWLESAARKLIN